MGKKLDSDKVILGKLFEDFWFLIPEYQRPYVWEQDNIYELLEDLWDAFENHNENEYFMGSLVLKKVHKEQYPEYEVLDGQQRLTTFFLILSVLKNKTNDSQVLEAIKGSLFQKENRIKRIPERVRIVYKIRGDSDKFLKKIALQNLQDNRQFNKDISIKNMINALKVIKDYFEEKNIDQLNCFADFLFNNIVFIYVAAENREDAFRLFTILNNRGIPLTSADILKAINIGEIEKLEDEKIVEEYASKWETIQNELEDDFERFLGFTRTILLKEKARKNLLEEFEKIYNEGLLDKGKKTVEEIQKYYSHYTNIIDFGINDMPLPECSVEENNAYKNLIAIMRAALPSTDWIPSLLYFYDKFKDGNLLLFLKKLEFKFSSDWILYFTPTQRIENMNKILRAIDNASLPETVLNNTEIFQVNIDDLKKVLSENVYGKRFTKFVLLKHEYLSWDNSQFVGSFSLMSVEHILPQKPPLDSKWRDWFLEEEIEEYKHKLGNLVLLSRRKNSSLSNLDFEEKKKKYFQGSISTFPSINLIMQKQEWKKEDIVQRTGEMIQKLTNVCNF